MENERGFTLVEILVSIVILSVIVPIFFQFFVVSQKVTTNNEDKLVAITVAEDVLDRIKHNLYPELVGKGRGIYTGDDCTGTNKDECLKRYNIERNHNHYVIQIEIVEDGPENVVGLKLVEVKVFDDNGYFKSSVKGFVEL